MDDLLGLEDLGEPVETRVGYLDHSDVELHPAVSAGIGVASRERVENRRLAATGKAHDGDLHQYPAAGSTTFRSSSPRANRRRLSQKSSIERSSTRPLDQDVCGVTMTLGSSYKGDDDGNGSSRNASRTAPPMRPSRNALTSARSSTRRPRATLISHAPGLTRASISSLITLSVSGVRAAPAPRNRTRPAVAASPRGRRRVRGSPPLAPIRRQTDRPHRPSPGQLPAGQPRTLPCPRLGVGWR